MSLTDSVGQGLAKGIIGGAKAVGKGAKAGAKVVKSPTARKAATETVKHNINRSSDPRIQSMAAVGQMMGAPIESKSAKVMNHYDRAKTNKTINQFSRKGTGPSLNKKPDNLSKAAHHRLEDTRDKMEELKKEALDGDAIGNTAVGMGLGTLMAGGAAMALGGGMKAVKNKSRERKTERIWDKIKAMNPELADQKGRENFEVLQQFAPDLATNPTVARSYLQRANQYNMTPHEFVKELANTQSQIDRSDDGVDANRAVQSGASLSNQMNKQSSLQDFQSDLDSLDPR